MLKKEKVMTVEEFLQIEKMKEIEIYISKDKQIEKVFVFMLGSLSIMIESIYKNVNKPNDKKYCVICGNEIKSKSNMTKYCKGCKTDIEKKIKLKCWHKNKHKYR